MKKKHRQKVKQMMVNGQPIDSLVGQFTVKELKEVFDSLSPKQQQDMRLSLVIKEQMSGRMGRII